MQRFLIPGALLILFGGMGVTRYASMEERLASLDEFRRATPGVVAELRSEYQDLDQRLGHAVQLLETLESGSRADREGEAALREELGRLHASVRSTLDELEHQRSALTDLETRQAQRSEPADETLDLRFQELEAGVQALEAGVDHRYAALTDVVRSAVTLAEDARSEVQALRSSRRHDGESLWDETMGPTVQLAGSSTVGSGVLLPSRPVGEGTYETLLLTAWHVVRDIRSEQAEGEPVPVLVYERGGVLRREEAHLVARNVELDVALMRLESTRPMPCGARLASREHLGAVSIFDEVIAVGCPLGNDPIPTRGEVAELDHRVDGNAYWMISAPTYIGNSGGGIYDAATHELIGIFSKIYTHGSLRPTVVPHMGLITPLGDVYDWLEREGIASVLEPDPDQPRAAAGLALVESGD